MRPPFHQSCNQEPLPRLGDQMMIISYRNTHDHDW